MKLTFTEFDSLTVNQWVLLLSIIFNQPVFRSYSTPGHIPHNGTFGNHQNMIFLLTMNISNNTHWLQLSKHWICEYWTDSLMALIPSYLYDDRKRQTDWLSQFLHFLRKNGRFPWEMRSFSFFFQACSLWSFSSRCFSAFSCCVCQRQLQNNWVSLLALPVPRVECVKVVKSTFCMLYNMQHLSQINSTKAGVFTCVGWQVTLCDPIWQVTLHSCVMEFVPLTAYSTFTFYLYKTDVYHNTGWAKKLHTLFIAITLSTFNQFS